MKIKLDDYAIQPTRAHETDAGLDLYAPYDFSILPYDRIKIQTGVHVELLPNTYGGVNSKSGKMAEHGILTDGTIDEGYTGEISVVLFNVSRGVFHGNRGDKIAQLVVQPVLYPEVEIVEELPKTMRGDKGFGSTGR